MSDGTKVFESKLEGDINYEVHVARGFSGRSEIAVKVEGEIVSVVTVEKKRSGNIACRPAKSGFALIKMDPEELAAPNLDDILERDQDESTEQ